MPSLSRCKILCAELLGKSAVSYSRYVTLPYLTIRDAYSVSDYCFPFNFSLQQLAKHQLKEAFVKAHLGSWVKKPIEQDMFEVDI